MVNIDESLSMTSKCIEQHFFLIFYYQNKCQLIKINIVGLIFQKEFRFFLYMSR